MDEEVVRMMKRWRNILCPMTPPEMIDREIHEINKMEASLGEMPEETDRIRALTSRVDPLCHCRIFDNIDFIINAIGSLTYPGSPSVDVLERCVLRGGQLPSDIKERANGYIYSLDSWLKGRTCDEALEDQPQYTKLIQRVYSTIGQRSPHKEWLVASLVKTLKEHAYTPIDWLSQFSHGEVIDQLYKTALDRAPTREEAELTLQELRKGKSPVKILYDIIDSKEYMDKHLPESLKEGASEKDFVVQVYRSILDRDPSPDDLEFRVKEIAKEGTRDGVMKSVIRSREHVNRQLRRIVEALKAS